MVYFQTVEDGLEHLETIFPVLNRHCWCVFLSCAGEPLLHPQLAEVFQAIARHLPAVDVCLITNGWNLTEEKRRLLIRSGISRVFVSIDTVDPEQYRMITSCGSEGIDRVKKNVESLVKERGRGNYPKVTVTAVAARSTLAGIPAVARWAMAAGADSFKVLWFIPCSNIDMNDETITFDASTRAILHEAGAAVRARKKIFEYPYLRGMQRALSAGRAASLYRHPLRYLTAAARKLWSSFSAARCRMVGNTLLLTNDGQLYLCPNRIFPILNLLENPEADLRAAVAGSMKSTSAARRTACPGCSYAE